MVFGNTVVIGKNVMFGKIMVFGNTVVIGKIVMFGKIMVFGKTLLFDSNTHSNIWCDGVNNKNYRKVGFGIWLSNTTSLQRDVYYKCM